MADATLNGAEAELIVLLRRARDLRRDALLAADAVVNAQSFYKECDKQATAAEMAAGAAWNALSNPGKKSFFPEVDA